MAFPEGFPLPFCEQDDAQPMAFFEGVMTLNAASKGVRYVDLFDATTSMRDGMRSDVFMPILVDYMTLVISPSLQLKYQTAFEENMMMSMLEKYSTEQPLNEFLLKVSSKVNRPAIYNRSDNGSILGAKADFRKTSGTPSSVTLLMMDMALDDAIKLSIEHADDAELDTLDLTPTVDLLSKMDVSPCVEVPQDVDERVRQSPQIREPESRMHRSGDS